MTMREVMAILMDPPAIRLINRRPALHEMPIAIPQTRPHLLCKDGFKVSIQASAYAYCSPRDNCGPYIKFELGFPNRPDDLIMSYAEDEDDPTGTVYPYVPVEVVYSLIESHGGPDRFLTETDDK